MKRCNETLHSALPALPVYSGHVCPHGGIGVKHNISCRLGTLLHAPFFNSSPLCTKKHSSWFKSTSLGQPFSFAPKADAAAEADAVHSSSSSSSSRASAARSCSTSSMAAPDASKLSKAAMRIGSFSEETSACREQTAGRYLHNSDLALLICFPCGICPREQKCLRRVHPEGQITRILSYCPPTALGVVLAYRSTEQGGTCNLRKGVKFTCFNKFYMLHLGHGYSVCNLTVLVWPNFERRCSSLRRRQPSVACAGFGTPL